MKDWISLLQTLTWPGVILIVTLIVIIIFFPLWWKFFGIIIKFFSAITERVDSGSSVSVGPLKISEGSRVVTLKLGEDLRDIDKISEEEKNQAVTELAQKREEDYVYGDCIILLILLILLILKKGMKLHFMILVRHFNMPRQKSR